ncbi:type II toxin-antitoxin system RelE/ParE family toxin [Anaerolineales bacterium HSG24]|nr:type II toxin-antitoxin system RelE/ParE family toxin [Anaerolineales bacterium HSG24]
MNYLFHPEAEQEFEQAIEYYESCQQGLGLDFALEVRATVKRIVAFPNAWPFLEDDIRRCQTNRFPYGLVYVVESDGTILFLAVMHLHRKPNYWKIRI